VFLNESQLRIFLFLRGKITLLNNQEQNPPKCIKHALKGSMSYRILGIGDCTEHKKATKSGREIADVKPQALDQSNNKPEKYSRS
jgi:hypothetical protein